MHNLDSELEAYLKVLDTGGKEALMLKTQNRKSALHCFCNEHTPTLIYFNEELRVRVIENYIRVGGKGLGCMKDSYGATALHYECSRSKSSLVVVRKLLEVSVAELGMQAKAIPFYDEGLLFNLHQKNEYPPGPGYEAVSKVFLNPV